MLRVAPILGRPFTADDEIRGAASCGDAVSMASGSGGSAGDPDVIGKTIELSEETWEIVGVMPRDFTLSDRERASRGDLRADHVYRGTEGAQGDNRNYNWTVLGRLKDGVSIEQAHDQMNRADRCRSTSSIRSGVPAGGHA